MMKRMEEQKEGLEERIDQEKTARNNDVDAINQALANQAGSVDKLKQV